MVGMTSPGGVAGIPGRFGHHPAYSAINEGLPLSPKTGRKGGLTSPTKGKFPNTHTQTLDSEHFSPPSLYF